MPNLFNLWNPYLICVILGAIFGVIGSLLSWKSQDIFDWKAGVLAVVAVVSYLIAPYASVFAFVGTAAISALSGWISCLLLEESMSQVAFEHALTKGQFDAVIRPVILTGFLWVIFKLLALLIERTSIIAVQIKFYPGVGPWLVSLVLAMWAASIAALPRAYLSLRKEVMYRRSRGY